MGIEHAKPDFMFYTGKKGEFLTFPLSVKPEFVTVYSNGETLFSGEQFALTQTDTGSILDIIPSKFPEDPYHIDAFITGWCYFKK